MMKRRTFLRCTTFAVGPLLIPSSFVPLSAQPKNARSTRKLVLVHLQGGNDGFNTIVPYTNKNYYRLRPTIAIPARDVVKLDQNFGLNPSLRSLKPHFDKGNMLIINNVSCTHLDHSHYTASKVWESALSGNEGILSNQINLMHDEFGEGLKKLASEINLDSGNHIYRIGLDGFDTHQFQKNKQNLLLENYAEGMSHFLNELEISGQLQHTLIVTWSEFGRQLKENTQKGTDHGNSNCLFIYGGGLKVKKIHSNDVSHAPIIDLSNVYTALIGPWLKGSPITAFAAAQNE